MMLYRSIKEIANSVKARGSQQGEELFYTALKQLPELDSTEDKVSFLKRLNKALNGMEAHGEFTDEEYKVVSFLREKERVLDKLDSLLRNSHELLDDNETGIYKDLRGKMLE